MRRYLLTIALLLVSTVHAQDGVNRPQPLSETRTPISIYVDQMTLQQKAAQVFMVGLYGPNITAEGATFLREVQPGGIVVFAYNAGSAESVTTLINDWQSTITAAGAPPMLVAIDQEGGRINTLEDAPFTQFPVPALITASGNHNLAYRVGAAQSQELRAVGIHMNLAPVADLETNPDNPVIFRRAFGSDPRIVSPALSAVVQGMQDNGVIATLKHFPGHGDTDTDSHLELPVLPYDRTALDELELMPFRAGIEAGAEAVMVGHLSLPAIEPNPDLPASLSYRVVTEILREDLSFDGIIMTDALDMDAIDTTYSLPVASVMALNAGVDLLATGPHVGINTVRASIQGVIEAVENGDLPEARLDEAVIRILSAKYRYDVLNWSPLDPTTAPTRISAVGSNALVNEMFTSGVTLVYDSTGQLPFPQTERVLLIYPYHRNSILTACEEANPAIQRIGYSNYPTQPEIAEATRVANLVDHIVVFTQNAVDKPEQAQLVDALPPEKTTVVAYWSPYDINAFSRLPAAYMTTYSPHNAGLETACNVLFGALPARGKLPMHLSPTILAASGAPLTVR